MKKTIILILISLSLNVFAQNKEKKPFQIHFFGGLGISNFENQESSATGVIGGVDIGLRLVKSFEVGVELNSSLSPFNRQTDVDYITYEEDISQHIVGIYTNLYFYQHKSLDIFARIGGGYYWGNFKQIYTETITKEYKRTSGFHIGAGFHFDEGILVMVQYHVVKREFDEAFSQKLKTDNLQLLIGYRLSF